jgi:hypothetical protein
MPPIVLSQIQSLHVRAVQETGLKIRFGASDILTGPIVAILDDTAASPANTALLDISSGVISLQWAVIATLPFTADAFASGAISPKDSAVVRVALEENGQVTANGSGFAVEGTGQIAPGSVLSSASIPGHQNGVTAAGIGTTVKFAAALAAGDTVQCTFIPDACVLQLKLPRSLGGGTQSLNLTGGFLLVPVMTLERPDRTKRRRRS